MRNGSYPGVGAALLSLALACPSAAQSTAANPKTFTFDSDPVVSPPAGFEFARTGQGAEGRWIVRADPDKPSNHVLVQESSDPTDYRFPLAVVKDGTYKDATLSVRARPVSGKVDQGFGMVWRYKDADNYYITRCNADEDNCTIYHVIDGSRRAFQNHAVKVTSGAWHTLKMEARGSHLVVWFDGAKVLEARDDTFQSGEVGLWTKADSVIEFDDFTIAP